jgi:hypothetical protein
VANAATPLHDPLAFGPALRAALADVAGRGDDPSPAIDALHDAGLTDGLPVIPPRTAAIEALLAGRNPLAPACAQPLPIAFATPTWWDVAACAVLAGCPAEPALLDIAVAALDAVADPSFNLLGVQATTGAASPLVIVHGPVVARTGLHSGSGVLGPGGRRNAPLGRTVRLVLQNVGGARAGEADMATHGHPGKIGWLVAEHPQARRAAAGWGPVATALGLAADASAVTVFAGVGNVEVVLPTTTAEALAGRLAQVLAGLAAPEAVLLLPPDGADFLVRQGWDRLRLAEKLSALGVAPPLVVVTGGVGVKATVVPRWGGPAATVTRLVEADDDGR